MEANEKEVLIQTICELSNALGHCKAFIELTKNQVDHLEERVNAAIKSVGLNPDAPEFKIKLDIPCIAPFTRTY